MQVVEGYSLSTIVQRLRLLPQCVGIDRDMRRPISGNLQTSSLQGQNVCLGKPFVQIEMRKTVAELIRQFEMGIVRARRQFNSINRNGLFIQDDMLVRFGSTAVFQSLPFQMLQLTALCESVHPADCERFKSLICPSGEGNGDGDS